MTSPDMSLTEQNSSLQLYSWDFFFQWQEIYFIQSPPSPILSSVLMQKIPAQVKFIQKCHLKNIVSKRKEGISGLTATNWILHPFSEFQWVSSLHQVAKVLESFSFSISPSKESSRLISFKMDWFDLLAVQGTLKCLLQHHSSKASIGVRFWRSQ